MDHPINGPTGAALSAPLRLRVAMTIERTIFYGLLGLMILVAVPYGTVEPWWESLFECAVFALTALWVVEGFLSGAWRIGGFRLLLPLLAIAGFLFLQTQPLGVFALPELTLGGRIQETISADAYETRLVAMKFLALTLILALLLRYLSSPRRLRATIYAVIGVGAASAAFGLLRQTLQGNEAGFFLPHLLPHDYGYAQFINKNHFAFLIEMSLGLSLGLVLARGAGRRQWPLWVAASALLAATLVLANSRAGIISLLAEILLAALLLGLSRSRNSDPGTQEGIETRSRRLGGSFIRPAAICSLVVGAAIAFVLWVGGEPLVQRMQSLSAEVQSSGAQATGGLRRIDVWQATWQLIRERPITGSGFGAYATAVTRYQSGNGEWSPEAAHNDYLEFLAGGGVIGLLLGLWFLAEVIRLASSSAHSIDPFRRATVTGAILGLFAVAIHSLADFGLHVTINAFVFVVLVAIATLSDRSAAFTGTLRLATRTSPILGSLTESTVAQTMPLNPWKVGGS